MTAPTDSSRRAHHPHHERVSAAAHRRPPHPGRSTVGPGLPWPRRRHSAARRHPPLPRPRPPRLHHPPDHPREPRAGTTPHPPLELDRLPVALPRTLGPGPRRRRPRRPLPHQHTTMAPHRPRRSRPRGPQVDSIPEATAAPTTLHNHPITDSGPVERCCEPTIFDVCTECGRPHGEP